MHINDFPRPNSTLTRPLCILMIFLDLTRHLLDSNPDNSNEYLLLILIDRLGLYNFSTLQMKGHVLHRAHFKVPG